MDTSVVTRKGQVTIPARLRRRFRLEEGSVVAFTEQDGELVLRPVETSVEAAFGLVKETRTTSLEDMEAAIRKKGSE